MPVGRSLISEHLTHSAAMFAAVAEDTRLQSAITRAAKAIRNALRRKGSRLYIAGNGGSAADAQHFAAELVGWYFKNDRPCSAFALSTDTSFLTAWGNDDEFGGVFARQLAAHARSQDVFFAISTSGNSVNILRALHTARDLGVLSVGLLGRTGGEAKPLCDISICIPEDATPHIQEAHIAVIHAICRMVKS